MVRVGRRAEEIALISVADLAIREGLTYQQAYNRALRREFGQLERIEGRLYVREQVPAE